MFKFLGRARRRVLGWLPALAVSVGCTAKHVPLAAPAAPLTAPTRLCGPNEGRPACRSAEDIEALLSGPIDILGIANTPSGMQGAKVVTLRAHGRWGEEVIRAKWRPQSSEDLINEPRKELAAYAVQKLFLDPGELVAPPTVAYCFAGPEYRRFEPQSKSSFSAIDCVFGFLSYWLENVQSVKAARQSGLLGAGVGIWDAQLFQHDRQYRDSVSNCNLLTYLINHGDAHDEQFVLEPTPRGLRAYVVDNSIAFRSIKNPMLLFRQDWSQIQVPALSPKSVGRLQHLTADEFARLGDIGELTLHDGALTNSPSRDLKSDGTTMSWSGARLRIGLTQGEIELVQARVHDLLTRADLPQLLRL